MNLLIQRICKGTILIAFIIKNNIFHLIKNQYLCAFQNFMKNIILLISASLLIFSCGNSSEETNQMSLDNVSVIFGEENYVFTQLSSQAKEQAGKWDVLNDFLSETKQLNGGEYQDIRNRSERLQQFSDSLIKSVPEALNSNPINSRLVVIKTRSDILYQNSHKAILDSAGIQNAIVEMNSAVDNLIMHLNEKFEKERIDLQRKDNEEMELNKLKKSKDSIMNLELQDQNRRLP